MSDAPGGNNVTKRPNFIVILADDMGFSDIGCFGSEIPTPNIDSIARGGIRFTQMYNCARCCPSRASLLTGLYPHQVGIGHMVYDKGTREYQGYLTDDCVTIAEALRADGYRTYMTGKWHIGGVFNIANQDKWRPGAPGFPTPITRGFDKFYGTLAGACNYYNPYSLMENDRLIEPEGDFFYTEATTDHSVDMIQDAVDRDQPFFMYVAYNAPHWPLHARQRDVEKHIGKYRKGWDATRTARHEELQSMGLLDEKWDISPRDELAPGWDELDSTRHDWEDIRMAVYAAQIDAMDQGIGKILAKLRDSGIEDDTVVMFMSDNGGCAEFLAEEGYVMANRRPTRDGKPMRVGNQFGRLPGPDDTFMSYELPWSNVSNAPFRLHKGWVHEGGISTPFAMSGPGVANPGGIYHQPMHFVDIMPTLLEMAGVDYPDSNNGLPTPPMEGESFTDLMADRPWKRQAPIYFEHEGNRAIRIDNWKLVSRNPQQWEMYDMNVDRTELHDQAAKDAGRVGEMEALYNKWAERVRVIPWEPKGPLKVTDKDNKAF